MIRWMGRDQHSSLVERERYSGEWRNHRPEKSVFLQTCNRVELYHGDGLTPEETVRHLFRVTAGLESVIVGETGIQRQVKTAYADSIREGRCTRGLHLLFQAALRVGKRVRSETGLSKGAPTHAQIAFRCVRERVLDLGNARVLVVGVNHLARGIALRLRDAGAPAVFIANRTFPRACDLAEELQVHPLKMEEVNVILPMTDVLVTVTSSPVPLFTRRSFPKKQKMLVVDLGVPRNVEERVGGLKNVTLVNIEEVENLLERDVEVRLEEIPKSEAILEEELSLFLARNAERSPAVSRAS